jgi:integrase
MASRFSMMALKRAKSGSGAFTARKRLPKDIRRDYQALYGGPAWEEKLTIPAGTPPDEARAISATWLATIEGRIAALRTSKSGKGVDLTEREAAVLAGDWYRWFTSQHLDNPGNAEGWVLRQDWSALRQLLWDMAELAGNDEAREVNFHDPEVLRGIDIEARASQFLMDRVIALTQAGRTRFLSALVREFIAATELLERRARGDWGPDQHLDQLAPSPTLSPGATAPLSNGQRSDAAAASKLPSAVSLFEAHSKDKQLAAQTIARRRCMFTALDAARAAEGPKWDAQKWLDGLIGTGAPPRTPATVRLWLTSIRAVFAWAVLKKRVAVNPFDGCTVDVRRAIQTRETHKAFTNQEIQTILGASLALGNPPKPPAAARRWVPWLLAYTGARPGEITQLRVQDIEMQACGPVLRITPDAGPVKTRKVRLVPIHSHLVEMGLLDYVEAVKARIGTQGPLFFRPRRRPPRTATARGPADRMREMLGRWVRRDLGVNDQGVQPLHGWRHTFLTRATRARIDPRMRDEIVGHVPRTVADQYEHPIVEDMAEALKDFPRYQIAT